MTLRYNAVEEESIVLKAIWDLAQDCVNYSIFCKFSDPANVTLLPNTPNDLRLFNILVGDFLSAPKAGTLGLPGISAARMGQTEPICPISGTLFQTRNSAADANI